MTQDFSATTVLGDEMLASFLDPCTLFCCLRHELHVVCTADVPISQSSQSYALGQLDLLFKKEMWPMAHYVAHFCYLLTAVL